MGLQQETVHSFQALDELLSNKPKSRVFILFTGSKLSKTGESWCPDCVVAEPVIEKVIKSTDLASIEALLITCYVGQRDEWKNPQNNFRTDQRFKVNCVPTLIELGTKKRLTEDQLTNEHLLLDFFGED
uniref:Thioredoxin domain-containing protein 17 n=1 Tax=Acrobeloides nanus TaxID=290746 RepID=A0A914CNM0_9BILA